MKTKTITIYLLIVLSFNFGISHSLQAENIKGINFIHNNGIRGCKVFLQQNKNTYFAPVYNQQQTIEMCVRMSETFEAAGGVLISTKSAFVNDPTNDNKSGGYELMLQPNGWARATFCVGNEGNDIKWINTGLQAGEWARLSVVIDGSNLICYKNGVKTVEQAFKAPIAIGTGDLTIGANPNWEDGEKFQGIVTDVRIWSTVRSEIEIQQDMNIYFSTKKPNLFLNWNMQEGEGNILKNLMHSTRNQAEVVLINDMDKVGIEWKDNSGCPILKEGGSSIENLDIEKPTAYINESYIIISDGKVEDATIYSIDGRLVMKPINSNRIEIASLPTGYYIFKAIINERVISLKLKK